MDNEEIVEDFIEDITEVLEEEEIQTLEVDTLESINDNLNQIRVSFELFFYVYFLYICLNWIKRSITKLKRGRGQNE